MTSAKHKARKLKINSPAHEVAKVAKLLTEAFHLEIWTSRDHYILHIKMSGIMKCSDSF